MDKAPVTEINPNVIDVSAAGFEENHIAGTQLTTADGATGTTLLGCGARDADIGVAHGMFGKTTAVEALSWVIAAPTIAYAELAARGL